MCDREKGLICLEHDPVLQELKSRMDAVLGPWAKPRFVWCSAMGTEGHRVRTEARNLFGNDGPVTQAWDGRF